MIDWITVLIPLEHPYPFNSGRVISVDSDDNIEWLTEKHLVVQGSYTGTLRLKSVSKDRLCSHLLLDGNLVKWFQGHNVWGTNDLMGLIVACLNRILPKLWTNIPDSIMSSLSFFVGMSRLSRIDITYMYDVGSSVQATSWIKAAAESANMQYRGKGEFTGGTLYFGKNSRRWALKIYSKGVELKKHKPKLRDPSDPNLLDSVTDYAEKAIRVELVLRSLELATLGLSQVNRWHEDDFERVYSSYLSGLQFSENMKVSTVISDLEKLPPRLRAVTLAWSEGHDPRVFYPRATWYRYRNEILSLTGLDIALRSPKNCLDASNVVPLIRVIEAKPMSIPDFAYGTSLYFEPNLRFG